MNSFGDLDVRLKIPDLWQQEALQRLKEGRDVVVSAPTGAGKTFLVELVAERRRQGQIVLAVPTRALANDKLREFRAKGWRVGIVTGDVSFDVEAPLVVATLETQKPRFLQGKGPSLFVIDEYQMIGDAVRGVNYELCVAMAPDDTQLLLLSGSVSNPESVVEWLRRLGRSADLVSLEKRPVPLEAVQIDGLPGSPPRSVTGYWPRLVAKALMADLGPILVFAPQRKAAESLARQLAAALPIENWLALSSVQKRLAGGTLERLLARRVAFHHSGLSYQQRAGLVEPLAKAGQLRVVVATTGLAAGVNFSMRSVLVTESQFTLGDTQQLIRPDELLQMFGRAGRRGLDTVGYALEAPDRPRLREGRALPIRRPKLLDWPSLIGVLEAAQRRGAEPFEWATRACSRLFDTSPALLGVENALVSPNAPCSLLVDAERSRHAQPESVEIRNSREEWEPRGELVDARLGEAVIAREGKVAPALSLAGFVEGLGKGSLAVVEREEGRKVFGLRRLIGYRVPKTEDQLKLAGWLKQRLAEAGTTLPGRVGLEFVTSLDFAGLGLGKLERWKWERGQLQGVFDYRDARALLDVDVFGQAVAEPELRKAYPLECLGCPNHLFCETELKADRSPAWSWRQLGLIGPRGEPTLRGRVFSLFQGGEGLAVAAALEEASYSVDAIAHDIANLRAGYRFDEFTQYSHRLARACRLAYGDRSYEGYLRHGLPPQYGEGAAEVIAEWMHSAGKGRSTLGENLSFGDVQRAKLEWLSLLRHIANAPELDWERWKELQAAARAILAVDDQRLLADDLPPLEPSQLGRVSHLLRFPRGF